METARHLPIGYITGFVYHRIYSPFLYSTLLTQYGTLIGKVYLNKWV